MQRDETLESHLFAAAGGLLAGAVAFLVTSVVYGDPLAPDYEPPGVTEAEEPTLPDPEVPPTPAQHYMTSCGGCHQAEGQGVPGAFPPLAGSEWTAGDAETLIRIALLGLNGPIEVAGETWDATMPPPVVGDDEQLARILSHVRQTFGDGASAVTATQVRDVRSELGERSEAWTAEELRALRVDGGP